LLFCYNMENNFSNYLKFVSLKYRSYKFKNVKTIVKLILKHLNLGN